MVSFTPTVIPKISKLLLERECQQVLGGSVFEMVLGGGGVHLALSVGGLDLFLGGCGVDGRKEKAIVDCLNST